MENPAQVLKRATDELAEEISRAEQMMRDLFPGNVFGKIRVRAGEKWFLIYEHGTLLIHGDYRHGPSRDRLSTVSSELQMICVPMIPDLFIILRENAGEPQRLQKVTKDLREFVAECRAALEQEKGSTTTESP